MKNSRGGGSQRMGKRNVERRQGEKELLRMANEKVFYV